MSLIDMDELERALPVPLYMQLGGSNVSPASHNSSQTPPSISSTPPPSPFIHLQVGNKNFFTSRSVLVASPVLHELTMNNDPRMKTPEGAYCIASDPAVFKHIHSFLSRNRYPMIFNMNNEPNYAEYAALEAEAAHWKIETLRSWLEKKGYEKLFTTCYEMQTYRDLLQLEGGTTTCSSSSESCQHIPFSVTDRDVYRCPRRIAIHGTSAGNCGRECAREDERLEENGISSVRDVAGTGLLVVTKTVTFHPERLDPGFSM